MHVYECMHVCMYVCIPVYLYVCKTVCLYVCLYGMVWYGTVWYGVVCMYIYTYSLGKTMNLDIGSKLEADGPLELPKYLANLPHRSVNLRTGEDVVNKTTTNIKLRQGLT